jgi:uncharacterized protein with ParB-like and HNH nuclease domain
MEVEKLDFSRLVSGERTFTIPVFQRNYDWGKKQCQQLFKDIEDAANTGIAHFIGTIVCNKSKENRLSWDEFFVIDGQQRIASIMLLLKALINHPDLDKTDGEKIWEHYLTNKFSQSDKFKLKLKPIESDLLVWKNIINGTISKDNSSNLTRNYELFLELITKSTNTPQEILNAVGSLSVVCLTLDPAVEKPQVIFESINSTGKSLTQGDLIRNYLLMNEKNIEMQIKLYQKYWVPIEQYCQKDESKVPDFIRDYLTMKNSAIVNIKDVYDNFQKHSRRNFGDDKENLLAELSRYAKYYSWFLGKSDDKEIDSLMAEFNAMKITVAFSALLWFFDKCYHEQSLLKKDLIKLTKILLSYHYRRIIFGLKSNALNNLFASLPREIGNSEDIPTKLLELLAAKKRSLYFPRDEDFEREFISFDMYRTRYAKYTLIMLERYISPKENALLNDKIWELYT